MSRIFFLLLLFCSITASAQTLNNQSVIRDKSGKTYPYEEWYDLLLKGDCDIKPGKGSEFVLTKYTPEEKKKKMEENKPRPSANFAKGQPFAPFNTTDINGGEVDLRKSKGKITVLNFWFINCPPCRREIPDLNRLVDSFSSNNNVQFIGIALDGKNELQTFLSKMPFKYRIVDDGRLIAGEYKVASYPTHVILDQEGKVYFHTSGLGPSTLYWLEKSIKELLKKGEN